MAQPPTESPLLIVSDIMFHYGTAPALKAVTFALDAGQLVVLIGRNGAGKSTLLRCIAGWTGVDRGDIIINAINARHDERRLRQQVILVPDTPPFYDELSAWEHLQFIAQLHALDNWRQDAEHLMRQLGVWLPREKSPLSFSRGMRYKLALCAAFMVKPPLLLLDEPFGPLDPGAADTLWEMLTQYTADGMTVMLSSHALPNDAPPDSYVILDRGEFIAQGTPGEIAPQFATHTPSLHQILAVVLDG